jgi:hypothetical protein
MQVTKRPEKEIVEHRFGRWDPNGRRFSPSYREGTSGAYLVRIASLLWDRSGTRRTLKKGKRRRRIRLVVSRSGTRTTERSRQREAVEKQDVRRHVSEHTLPGQKVGGGGLRPGRVQDVLGGRGRGA